MEQERIIRLNLMRAIAKEISSDNSDAVLKGGTALLLCYELDRFSEDLDFDLPAGMSPNFENSIKRATKAVGMCEPNIIVKKDTETTKRYMIHYGAVRDGESQDRSYPLKVECSMRSVNINQNDITTFDGIRVYNLSVLAKMKTEAFANREKARDIYDVAFLTSKYPSLISEETWEKIEHHLELRGIDTLSEAFENEAHSDSLMSTSDSSEIVLRLQENLLLHKKIMSPALQQREGKKKDRDRGR